MLRALRIVLYHYFALKTLSICIEIGYGAIQLRVPILGVVFLGKRHNDVWGETVARDFMPVRSKPVSDSDVKRRLVAQVVDQLD